MDQNNQSVSYQYQILRYRPDAVSGEFVNVGLVYFDPASRFLKAGMLDKYKRISQFFSDVSGAFLMQSLKHLSTKVAKLSQQLVNELDYSRFQTVADVTATLLPPDDNGLFFSETFKGWHISHEVSFEELYQRIVEQYLETSTERHDDSYAWKHVYKTWFDRYHLTEKLKSQTVKTATDAFDFDKTYQNGALHCFQSLSFDLKNDIAIKNKIYLWSARINELKTSEQLVKLYLLSVFPKNKDYSAMLESKLSIESENIVVELVQEEDAEKMVKKVKEELEAGGY